jgi:hypothetical protein
MDLAAAAAAAAHQHLYCEGMEEGDTTDNIAATYQVGPVVARAGRTG